MFRIKEYEDLDGRNHFREWYRALEKNDRFRMDRVLGRLEDGNFSNCKHLGLGVYEVKMYFGPGFRIYYGRVQESVVLLLEGGSKQRQSKDVETAQRLWAEFASRER